jgi:HD superfamily phosphohydrolase
LEHEDDAPAGIGAGDDAGERGPHGGGDRLEWPDPLYGRIRIARWAAALLETPPFRRLAGVSLSDVPGELLFGRRFPSRLDHALGVYHLARLARPRDRALHAAALAHDLGHGPFSHLTEPLMRERFGEDHEARSARLLSEVCNALSPADTRMFAWLDWDEVARLVLGGGADGRGELLNGLLDYDNADNVARFLLASDLGTPGYDPRALARGLRPLTDRHDGSANARVCLSAEVEAGALAWCADRARVYRFLHEGHRNLAAHSMLRKAVDLATALDPLPPSFFKLTDAGALHLLGRSSDRGLAVLVARVRQGEEALHRCVWEAEAPEEAHEIDAAMVGWRERLDLEQRLAAEAGLAPHDVVVEVLTSRAERSLPPICQRHDPLALVCHPQPAAAPRVIHVFIAADADLDSVRRLHMAAKRRLSALGAVRRRQAHDKW